VPTSSTLHPWELGTFPPESLLPEWPGIPAAAVELGAYFSGPQSTVSFDVIDVTNSTFDSSVDAVARWLARSTAEEVTALERGMLEALVTDVLQFLDGQSQRDADLREDLAQVRAGVETIETQLRAPRPSREVLGWALSQVSAYAVGLASGVTLNHLPELMQLFH
jgi:hypothetical protein